MIWKFFFWESSLTSILLPQMGKNLQMKIYNKYFMPSIKDDNLFSIPPLSTGQNFCIFLRDSNEYISITSNGIKGHHQNT